MQSVCFCVPLCVTNNNIYCAAFRWGSVVTFCGILLKLYINIYIFKKNSENQKKSEFSLCNFKSYLSRLLWFLWTFEKIIHNFSAIPCFDLVAFRRLRFLKRSVQTCFYCKNECLVILLLILYKKVCVLIFFGWQYLSNGKILLWILLQSPHSCFMGCP